MINARTTNWCVVPWATPEWARVVHPGLDDEAALAKLWEQLVYVLRLDEHDAAAAWRERVGELHAAGQRLDARRLDALHFEGPGTDLTVGPPPDVAFRRRQPGATTVDGVVVNAEPPTEEVFTTPDPRGSTGVVTATKPLDVERNRRRRTPGAVRGRPRGLDRRRQGAEALRARCAKDDGAARLGEVALVDREGRIGKTDTVFFNTLLDENAASHLAFGNAYAISVGDEDRGRINRSAVHVDFMVGSNDVAVTGLTPTAPRCPSSATAPGSSRRPLRRRRASRRARRPLTSRGSPRSANGTSITSKSRGDDRRREDSRASSASSGRSSAATRA